METAAEDEGRVPRATPHAAACLSVQRPVLAGETACTACARACPAQAIGIGPRRVGISAAACTGCGLCAAACPTGALEVEGFALPAQGATQIECSRVRPADRVPGATVVPCLGGLTHAALRDALIAGGVTLIDRGWCAGCPVAGTAAPWSQALEAVRAEAELAGFARAPGAVSAPLDPARAEPPPQPPAPEARSRRGWIARFARHRTHAPAGPGTPPAATETPALAARHDALQRMAGGELPPGLMPELTPAVARPDLDLAARLCPTGALGLSLGDGVARLGFDAARCISCGDCEAAGFELRARGTRSHVGTVTLAEAPLARCARCKMRFRPEADETRCAQCAKDDDIAALAHGLMRRRG